ncbi:MAG: glycosyltransferase [Planctomycetota bacterium]|nr:glycosyltransferase [Planctomycetota bacterium]
MRILLAQQCPIDRPWLPPGKLENALLQTGHTLCCLKVVSEREQGNPASSMAIPKREILCSADDLTAELPFGLPGFTAENDENRRTYDSLTDHELAEYRAVLRDALDELINEFDPHIVVVQYLWVFAHLALESGVPYVVQVHGPELATAAKDPRYRPLVEQAGENAGRLLVAGDEIRQQLLRDFEFSPALITQWPTAETAIVDKSGAAEAAAITRQAEELVGICTAVVRQRFGQIPD